MIMDKDDALFIFGMLMVGIGLSANGFLLGTKLDSEIKSDHPIIPELQITIENGVADTAYIYRTE